MKKHFRCFILNVADSVQIVCVGSLSHPLGDLAQPCPRPTTVPASPAKSTSLHVCPAWFPSPPYTPNPPTPPPCLPGPARPAFLSPAACPSPPTFSRPARRPGPPGYGRHPHFPEPASAAYGRHPYFLPMFCLFFTFVLPIFAPMFYLFFAYFLPIL